MKTIIRVRKQSGKILIVTLVIALLVALAVGALLVIAKNQSVLTARSQTWASEIPIAEAGVEEAMAHINSRPSSLATNGWAISGSKFVKSRNIGSGYFFTEITATKPPVIRSIGFGRIPLQTNFTSRAILVTTRPGPPAWGIVARNNITLGGLSALVDSFDSSDPRYSGPGGVYDPLRRLDRAGVATLSSNRPAIDTGTAKIYGSVATGPGGTAVGAVGDGQWLSTSSGIQPGHFFDDFNMSIPDATLPSGVNSALSPPTSGSVSSMTYRFVLGNNDYSMTSLFLNGDDMVITGKARLYITGDFKVTGGGSITITSTGTLELYVGGAIDLGGRGVVNLSQTANSCSVFGLPTCVSFKYSGSSALTARVYAPNADIQMGGSTDFYGSMVGNRLDFSGTPGIHYDEALGTSSPDFRIASWEEL
jgi:hypothetical protein